MHIINSYLISITLLCVSYCALNTATYPAESEVAITKEENRKKKPSDGSYLEKIQRRYISRLPYLMIPVMIVPVIKRGDLAGHLTIMVELKGTGTESYRKLQIDSVLLRDEIFCDLYFAMSRLWLGPETPSANIIENRIKKRINAFYKKELVENVRLHTMQLSLIHHS